MGVFDERNVGRAVWLLLGIAIAAVVLAAMTTYVGAFLFAVFLYFATRPLCRLLEGYLDHPNVAVSITLLAVILPMLCVVGFAIVVALQELDQFLSTRSLDAFRSFLQPYLGLARAGQLEALWGLIATDPGRSLDPAVRDAAEGVLGQVPTVAGAVFAVLAQLFLMSIFLFYLLRDDHEMRDWFFESIDYDARVVGFVSDVSDDLETVFFGNLAIVAVTGSVAIATYLVLDLLGTNGDIVSIPILLGLLTGIATLIPLVGMKIVYLPYTAYLVGLAVTTGTPVWYPAVFFVVTLVVVDTIPDFFIRSYLASRSGVHMGFVLMGYALGTLAFGWAGLFLGPIVVVLGVHFARSIFPDLVEHVSFS